MNKQSGYWINESFETLDSAKILLQNNKYLEAMFFCHLACEKMLKASYCNKNNEVAPKIHSLSRLAHLSLTEENMSEDQLDFLYELDTFQLEGRYPLDRQEIYSRFSTNEFERIFNRTVVLIEWLNQKMT